MPPPPAHRRSARWRQSTAAAVVTVVLVATAVVLDQYAPKDTSTTTSTTAAGGSATARAAAPSPTSAAPTTPGASAASGNAEGGGSSLRALDPSSTRVQAFPTAGTCHARAQGTAILPDPTCTPGALDPHVTQATIGHTICRPGGYTSSIRPPVRVTDIEKRAAMAAYGHSSSPRRYEFDHLVSLQLGGSPNAPANLWPEPGASPNPKDKIETRLHALVCDHQITLAEAQQVIATNWAQAYHDHLGADPAMP